MKVPIDGLFVHIRAHRQVHHERYDFSRSKTPSSITRPLVSSLRPIRPSYIDGEESRLMRQEQQLHVKPQIHETCRRNCSSTVACKCSADNTKRRALNS